MAISQNLKPWKPGQSGNPNGKPKGTKHLSTWIKEMLNDTTFTTYIRDPVQGYVLFKGAPLEAILKALIIKSVNGDAKAFELLCKYGYGTKTDITSQDERLVIPILSGLSKNPE